MFERGSLAPGNRLQCKARNQVDAAIHDARINDGGFRKKYGQVNSDDNYIPANIGQFNPFGYVAAGLNNDKTDKGNSQIPYNRKTNWGIGYDASIRQKKVRGVVQTTYRPRSLEFSHGEAPDNMLAATNGVTGAMMPGWLSQADVLTSLAPIANVRSDTFVVRTYGDIEPDYPGVKVWCEAIVQRVPEYIVDDVQDSYDGDTPHARPMEPYDDLNGNGERDTGEPFTDYDSNGKHSFIDFSNVFSDFQRFLAFTRFCRHFTISLDFRFYPCTFSKFSGKSLQVTSSSPGSTADAIKSKK